MAEEPADLVETLEPELGLESSPSWSQVWQLPVLLLGLGLLVSGTYLSMPKHVDSDFPGALDSAERALEAGDFELAQTELDKIGEHKEKSNLADQARYWMLAADRIFVEQRVKEWDLAENQQNIIRYYVKAKEMGADLDAKRIGRLAQAQVSLGRVDEALNLLADMKGQAPAERYGLVRQIIERRQAQGPMPLAEVMPLIKTLEKELSAETNPQERRAQEQWVAALRAKSLIEAGDPQLAIDFLVQKLPRLVDQVEEGKLAGLYLLLAKAHQHTGEYDDATENFLWAQKLVKPTDALNAEVFVGLGQLALAESDDPQDALDLFSQAVNKFPNIGPYVDALMGQGDSEAKLGLHGRAIDHLGRARNRLVAEGDPQDPRRDQLHDIARSYFGLSFDRSDYKLALRYLALLKDLYPQDLPVDLLVRFARTHELLGDRQMAQVEALASGEPDQSGPPVSQETRQAMFQEAAIDYRNAGDYYHKHATAVTIEDDVAHGESLWRAAECYDKGHRWKKSIEVYSHFQDTRQSDRRYLVAIHRLGNAFLADGQYQAAADKFEFLIENKSQAQVSFQSYVPLARVYMAMDKFDRAKHLLTQVVSDHPSITPASQEYRNALIELAKIHLEFKEFSDAIKRFTMAVDRESDPRKAARLIFYLADSYRNSVDKLEAKLKDELPQTARQRFEQQIIERLRTAQNLFGKVIEQLDHRDRQSVSPLELAHLRNAYFYQADCAYKLESWNEAISLYDTAAKRWEEHPISLVALIQIVNAYAEQGKLNDARLANNRALFQLNRIPESAFEDDSLPMTRDAWKNWLRWSNEGIFDTQANVAN